MISFQEAIHNVQTGTEPINRDKQKPRELSVSKIIEACGKYGVDPNEVIALALTNQARDHAKETGMTLKHQSDLAYKVLDKHEPSKRSIEHSGEKEIVVVMESSDAGL